MPSQRGSLHVTTSHIVIQTFYMVTISACAQSGAEVGLVDQQGGERKMHKKKTYTHVAETGIECRTPPWQEPQTCKEKKRKITLAYKTRFC